MYYLLPTGIVDFVAVNESAGQLTYESRVNDDPEYVYVPLCLTVAACAMLCVCVRACVDTCSCLFVLLTSVPVHSYIRMPKIPEAVRHTTSR